MPFAPAVVPPRQMITEIYRDNAQNILEKNSVSHMVGLLQQLNKVSTFAGEIFADILAQTDSNAQRISTLRNRLTNLESKVPKVEEMFTENAPSYFYDHPFTQREWQRKDPLHGLIFRRDRCGEQVNRRRDFATTAPNFSVMDQFSVQGPCIKNYSDPNFFMNEWLEAEKRKMEEERAKRKQRKERKKKKTKREVKKTIQAVQKKTYNALGAEFGDASMEASEVAVKQYTLSDESTMPTDVMKAGSPPAAADRTSKKLSMVANNYGGSQIADQSVPVARPGPPPSSAMINSQAGPPPAAAYGGGGPVPPPIMQQQGGGGGGGPPPIPGMGGPPIPPPQSGIAAVAAAIPIEPKRPLTGAEMAARSAAMAGNAPPPVVQMQQYERKEPEKPKAILPQRSMNFLAEIKGGTQLKAVGNIKREKPVDARSMLLANLKKGATLKHVDASSKPAKKEQEVDRTVHAILQRRAFLEDESDEESDESWGSESA